MGKPDQVLISKDEIVSIIPQKQPIVMIDSLVYSDEIKTGCSLKLRKDNIFIKNGLFSESGLVESIAQTAAARMGYISRTENKPTPVGFIAAVKDLRILKYPEVNSEIFIEIEVINQLMGITIITGRVTLDDQVIAVCEMKIFIDNNSGLSD